jgi:hypothetical protein
MKGAVGTQVLGVDPTRLELVTSAMREVRALLSCMFAVVQKYLQIRMFTSRSIHGCSPLSAWVGVLLV